jgi:hypothetical protein
MNESVQDKLRTYWSSADDQSTAEQQLDRYGLESYEREKDRVQLAILKLADGDLAKLGEMIVIAKRDYRDVLSWAEYPEEHLALWSLKRDKSAEEQARLDEIRRRDREQYDAWGKKE